MAQFLRFFLWLSTAVFGACLIHGLTWHESFSLVGEWTLRVLKGNGKREAATLPWEMTPWKLIQQLKFMKSRGSNEILSSCLTFKASCMSSHLHYVRHSCSHVGAAAAGGGKGNLRLVAKYIQARGGLRYPVPDKNLDFNSGLIISCTSRKACKSEPSLCKQCFLFLFCPHSPKSRQHWQ